VLVAEVRRRCSAPSPVPTCAEEGDGVISAINPPRASVVRARCSPFVY